MRLIRTALTVALSCLTIVLTGFAQGPPSGATRWKLTTRTTFAIGYPENELASVTMVGTLLKSKVTGHAEGRRKNGETEIKIRMENLPHPQTQGSSYTSYVIWVIPTEGPAENLGQLIVPQEGPAETEFTVPIRTFGLMLTAEPYPLVRYPGPLIVAENLLDKDSGKRSSQRVIEYQGDPGTFYAPGPGGQPVSLGADFTTPLSVLGARRAVEIARRAGAGRFAKVELQQAEARLAKLEQFLARSLANGPQDDDLRDRALEVMQSAEIARATAIEGPNAALAKLRPEPPRNQPAEVTAPSAPSVAPSRPQATPPATPPATPWARLAGELHASSNVRVDAESLLVDL